MNASRKIFFIMHHSNGLTLKKKDLIKMRCSIFILLLSIASVASYAQRGNVDEYRMQQEQLKKTQLLRELDSGIYLLDTENYLAADVKFRHVLENIKSVPSDLTFYFGKNSFYLKRYK